MKKINKIKVTVITGFLGAGKTTLINNLLKKYPDIRFALVENEFGDVSIDTQLIKGLDASSMFELKNGCISCSIAGEYELVLLELAEKFPEIDHLLIETTGVADPAPVIKPFLSDDRLKEIFNYNGAICLVDALNFETQPEKELSFRQIAAADIILINKTENVENNKLDFIHREIKRVSLFCRIYKTQHGNARQIELDSIISGPNPAEAILSAGKHDYHSDFYVKILIVQSPPDKEKFMNWLAYNLELFRNCVFRVKGVVYFRDDPYKNVIQGVGSSFEIYEDSVFLEGKESVIILIGKKCLEEFPSFGI